MKKSTLLKDKKFILCGQRAVSEALNNLKVKITQLYVLNQTYIPKSFKNLSIPITILSADKMQKLAGNEINHQGIIADINTFNTLTLTETITLVQSRQLNRILVVDHIEDSGNFGALLRSAAAFGFNAVIYANARQAPINAHALKTSQGYALQIYWVCVPNLANALSALRQACNITIIGSEFNAKAIPLNQVSVSESMVLILGNEAKGISENLQKLCHHLVFINMHKNVESLNVAAAGAIMMHTFASLEENVIKDDADIKNS